MFVTHRQFESAMDNAARGYERLNKLYWDLWHKHERLLKHLGLHEEKVPEKIEICAKTSPELGDS